MYSAFLYIGEKSDNYNFNEEKSDNYNFNELLPCKPIKLARDIRFKEEKNRLFLCSLFGLTLFAILFRLFVFLHFLQALSYCKESPQSRQRN